MMHAGDHRPHGQTLEEALAWHGVGLDVDPADCVEPRGLTPATGGYYYISVDHRRIGVHVAVWMLRTKSAVPVGQEIRHLCGRSSCCNPHHLRAGTPAENAADKERHGTHPRGERTWNAKLTEYDVREIRRLRSEGTLQRTIAASFGISRSHVGAILEGRKWTHLA